MPSHQRKCFVSFVSEAFAATQTYAPSTTQTHTQCEIWMIMWPIFSALLCHAQKFQSYRGEKVLQATVCVVYVVTLTPAHVSDHQRFKENMISFVSSSVFNKFKSLVNKRNKSWVYHRHYMAIEIAWFNFRLYISYQRLQFVPVRIKKTVVGWDCHYATTCKYFQVCQHMELIKYTSLCLSKQISVWSTCKCWKCHMLTLALCVFVSIGREGRGDSLSPEWHTLYRRRAGPLPSVCTTGLLPALQPRAGHFCLVNTHTHTIIYTIL